ncbi:NUDIX hydrolase [Actinoplanes sp. NPDC051633]|uniref:NUDIX hydrolase n=1 Tax=Actinoplanes sp. NPDC051633 TaxID=3155670 RepID=UPI0034490E4C
MTERSTAERPAIAAAVIVSDGRVLMVRRKEREGSLSWQFPAGQVEPGESGEEAAIRETQEEVGLTVDAEQRLGERIHPATGRRMIYVACKVLAGRPYVADAVELAEVQWCDRATLADYVPYPFFGPVQDYITSRLS